MDKKKQIYTYGEKRGQAVGQDHICTGSEMSTVHPDCRACDRNVELLEKAVKFFDIFHHFSRQTI